MPKMDDNNRDTERQNSFTRFVSILKKLKTLWKNKMGIFKKNLISLCMYKIYQHNCPKEMWVKKETANTPFPSSIMNISGLRTKVDSYIRHGQMQAKSFEFKWNHLNLNEIIWLGMKSFDLVAPILAGSLYPQQTKVLGGSWCEKKYLSLNKIIWD